MDGEVEAGLPADRTDDRRVFTLDANGRIQRDSLGARVMQVSCVEEATVWLMLHVNVPADLFVLRARSLRGEKLTVVIRLPMGQIRAVLELQTPFLASRQSARA
jgi:hypothetical protein